MRLPNLSVTLWLVTTACATAAPRAGDTADLAVTRVHIVDVVTGELLRDRTVQIRDGRITAIDPSDADTDRAERVIDGGGRFMMPGLWDSHVHFRGGDDLVDANAALLPLYIANGVTTVRDAGGDMTPAVLAWRREIDAGRLIGPRILTSGPKLDGPSGGWPGSIRLTAPVQARAALDSLQSIGVDYVKLYDGTLSRDVFLALLDEAERRDLIVTGHMPFTVRFLDAVERGLDATEHLYYAFKGGALNEDSVTAAMIASAGTDRPLGFWAALSLLMPQYDEQRADRVFRSMAQHGTAVVPTLHIGSVLSAVDVADHSADPELRYIDPLIQATYAGRVESAHRSSAQARRERRELQQTFITMVPRMHAAGVTILAGSDAGASNSYVYPGFSLHAELEQLVAAGLSPLEALQTATVNAAGFMRRGHESGRVAVGYRADLLLLEDNPLIDVRAARDIHTLILHGAVLSRAQLETLLEQTAH